MHKSRYLVTAIGITFANCLVTAAWAESEDSPSTYGEIVVIGTIESRSLTELNSPALGVGIDQEQIDAVNAVNTEDVIRYAPNVIIRKRYAGDANATLSFRNMHTQQTPRALVTIDGFVISDFLGADFDTAPKWAVVAPDDIDRAEIIYGPTSARYSGNSLGGTLRLDTRPITETGLRINVQGMFQHYKYYQTDEDLYGWSADSNASFKLGDVGGISIGYRHFENEAQPMQWRTVGGSTEFASQATQDRELTFLRIGSQDSVVHSYEDQLRFRGNLDLGGSWTARTLIAVLFDKESTLHPKSFLVDADGSPTFVGISGVSRGISNTTELLAGVGFNGELGNWKIDLAFSRYDVLKGKGRSSDNFDPATGEAPNTGYQTNNGAYWNSLEGIALRQIGSHALAVGLSYAGYHDENATYLTSDWRAAVRTGLRDASGGETRLWGVFAEDAIALTPAFTATFGLRYEDWRTSGGFLVNGVSRVDYPSRSEDAWSPKVAFSMRPDKVTELVASASWAKRFPTVRELYQAGLIAYGPNAGQLDLNGFDPGLKPERGLDLQLTASRRFGKIKLTVSGWGQDVRNAIFGQSIAIPGAGDPSILSISSLMTNIDKVRSYGLDAILAAEDIVIPGLSLDANVSWNRTEIKRNSLNPAYEGNFWPRVPEWRANASLRYKPDENWLLAANFRYQSTPDRDIQNSATSKCDTFYCVSTFSFVDLKATRKWHGLTFSVGVDNVLDDKAFVYHPYPGRSFLIEVSWDGYL